MSGYTVSNMLKDSFRMYQEIPMKNKLIGVAVKGGIFGGVFDDHDSVTSTGEHAVKDAAITAGLVYGTEKIIEHREGIKSLFKGVTASDVAKIEGESDSLRSIGHMKKVARGHGIATIGIAALIGAGTLFSASNSLHHAKETDLMIADTKEKQKKQEKKDQTMMSELFGYDKHQDMGQLVLDMWDDRIGHHKMGNAKFQ